MSYRPAGIRWQEKQNVTPETIHSCNTALQLVRPKICAGLDWNTFTKEQKVNCHKTDHNTITDELMSVKDPLPIRVFSLIVNWLIDWLKEQNDLQQQSSRTNTFKLLVNFFWSSSEMTGFSRPFIPVRCRFWLKQFTMSTSSRTRRVCFNLQLQ